jgi:hypothetical protein
MKKAALFALALGIAASVSAEDIAMSAGGGLFFGGDFGGGANYTGSDADIIGYDQFVAPLYGWGLHAFFDYEYLEAGLSFYWGGGRWSQIKGSDKTPIHDASTFSINIDALGKYPVDIMENMRGFPILGFAYHIVLWGEGGLTKSWGGAEAFDGKGGAPKAFDLSALWIKFGGGIDYAVSERIYIRPELTYGIRLANSYESNVLSKEIKVDENTVRGANGNPRLGHGLTLRAGVGYYL